MDIDERFELIQEGISNLSYKDELDWWENFEGKLNSNQLMHAILKIQTISLRNNNGPNVFGGADHDIIYFCSKYDIDKSEEHTSNSSHVKISYAVFCLKKKKIYKHVKKHYT